MYTGHVYNKSTNEPISGLSVSDGRNVSLTDENGSFELPGWERAALIYVNALTTSHDDWYIRIDSRNGDYDFRISMPEKKPSGKFLHISDTELGVGTTPTDLTGWGDFLKENAERENVDFIIHTGDICRKAGLEAHYKHMNYDTMGTSVRYTLGNHDYVRENYGEYTYECLYGPVWYSFELGEIHYVVLPIKNGETPSGYDSFDSDAWLLNDLKCKDPAKKLVIFCHEIACDTDFIMRDTKLDLKDYGILAWISGHYHNNFLWQCDGRYIISTARPDCGGIDSTPASVRYVEISDSRLISKILYNDLARSPKIDKFEWRTTLPDDILFSTPILQDEKIFLATSSDGTPRECCIYCLSANNGSIVWQYPIASGIKNPLCIAEGRIFGIDSFGMLYALDAARGSLIFEKKLDIGANIYNIGTPVYSNGTLFVGSSTVVTALNAENGEIIWKYGDLNKHPLPTPARYLLKDGILTVGSHWKELYALDALTGEKIWENNVICDHIASNVAMDGILIKPSRNTLYKLDARSGEILASVTPSPEVNFNTVAEPLLYDGKIYVSTASRGVMRFDLETLAVDLEYPCGKPVVPSASYATHEDAAAGNSPIIRCGALIFPSCDGYLYFYDPETARLLKKICVGSPIYTAPIVYGNYVITSDLSGNVTAFKV